MCYFISLQVIPQDKANKVKKKISFASFKDVKIFGKFPDYEISQGMCACGLVKLFGIGVIDFREMLQKRNYP